MQLTVLLGGGGGGSHDVISSCMATAIIIGACDSATGSERLKNKLLKTFAVGESLR